MQKRGVGLYSLKCITKTSLKSYCIDEDVIRDFIEENFDQFDEQIVVYKAVVILNFKT